MDWLDKRTRDSLYPLIGKDPDSTVYTRVLDAGLKDEVVREFYKLAGKSIVF